MVATHQRLFFLTSNIIKCFGFGIYITVIKRLCKEGDVRKYRITFIVIYQFIANMRDLTKERDGNAFFTTNFRK